MFILLAQLPIKSQAASYQVVIADGCRSSLVSALTAVLYLFIFRSAGQNSPDVLMSITCIDI
jgi:hypothetical protein